MDKDDKIFKANFGGDALELCGTATEADFLPAANNSFFDGSFFGVRAVFVITYFDDLIYLGGNTLLTLAEKKAEIFVICANLPTEEQKKELFAALKILNVTPDKIIFGNFKKNPERFREDLKKLLVELDSNIVFYPAFDDEPDYKNLSVAIDEIFGEIFRETDYRPEIYKKFIAATGFKSPPDFYDLNLLSTKKPSPEVCKIIDKAEYEWEDRVRFPVHATGRDPILKNSKLAEIALKFSSIRKNKNYLRAFNADENFFERRTDNQIFSAKISATSGDVKGLKNFKIVDDSEKKFLWQPDEKDPEKTLTVEWEEPVQISQIRVYGNFEDEESASISLKLNLSGSNKVVAENDRVFLIRDCSADFTLRPFGKVFSSDFEKMTVTGLEIRVKSCGKNFGISQIDVFKNLERVRKIPPFIKLTAKDEFFYYYNLPSEIKSLLIGVYSFHVDEPIKITAKSEDEVILNEVIYSYEKVTLNFGNKEEIFISAEVVGNPGIYDEAVIRRVGIPAQIQFKAREFMDRLRS